MRVDKQRQNCQQSQARSFSESKDRQRRRKVGVYIELAVEVQRGAELVAETGELLHVERSLDDVIYFFHGALKDDH